MALTGELSQQEQELVDFFESQDVSPFPSNADKAVKDAQKLYNKAQAELDKLPAFDPGQGNALRRRELALVQLLRAKAFRAVVANRYETIVQGPLNAIGRKEKQIQDKYKGDPTDFLTIADNLSAEIRTKPGGGAGYRQSDSFTAASSLATTDPVPSPAGAAPAARQPQGAVGATAPAAPAAGGSTAGQFRMAEQAAGQPSAATMADVQARRPAARRTRKTTPTTAGPGVAGGAAGADTAIPPSTGGQGKKDRTPWQQIIQREFGWASAYIGIDPTVDEALGQLARGEISETRFDAKIRSSDWWKNTNDFIRQWDLKERTVGSNAQKEIGDRVQVMQDFALAQFGVALPAESLRGFARESLRQGMMDSVWQNGVGAIITKGDNIGAVDQLRTGSLGQRIRKINADYGYDADTGFINTSISNIANGTMTEQSYKDQVLKQVKSLYGNDVGELLDQGYTLADVSAPYNQVAARTLEVDQVDFSDPKFRAALDFTDEKGQRRRMTLGEWQTKLRTDKQYGWDTTEQAKSAARDAASTILRAFGKVQ